MSAKPRGRGRSRVQGGWANSNQSKPSNRPTGPSHSQDTVGTAQHHINNASDNGTLHHVPPWIGKGVDSDMPAATVKFQQPTEEVRDRVIV